MAGTHEILPTVDPDIHGGLHKAWTIGPSIPPDPGLGGTCQAPLRCMRRFWRRGEAPQRSPRRSSHRAGASADTRAGLSGLPGARPVEPPGLNAIRAARQGAGCAPSGGPDMPNRRAVLFGLGACALCGCSGALHRLPAADAGQVSLAQAEIGTGALPTRRAVTDEEVLGTLRWVAARILGPARGVCSEIGRGICEWRFRAVRDRTMNASAMGNGLIVVNRGIVEYARSEDEVAFVLAHEIGHHAADHVRQSRVNTAVGGLIGGLLFGGAVIAAGGSGSGAVDAADIGMRAGGGIGRISFSKEQEREADYIAARRPPPRRLRPAEGARLPGDHGPRFGAAGDRPARHPPGRSRSPRGL